MKYKIIEEKYGDGEPYYIVKVPGLFGWKTCKGGEILSEFVSYGRGFYSCKKFPSIELAKEAITENEIFLKSMYHSKDVEIVSFD